MSENEDPAESLFTADLEAAASGDKAARNRLWSEHYEVLHGCARRWMQKHWERRGPEFGISLTGTDIVNQAYERLADRTEAMANGRAYFFRSFYTECSRIAVDHWRRTKNDKGRGGRRRIEFDPEVIGGPGGAADSQGCRDALQEFAEKYPRPAQIARLKLMRPSQSAADPHGLTNQDVADLMGLSLRTVEKEWSFAKAYLMKSLGAEGRDQQTP
jgi:RNA polymerase sigma factor (TIGR02999 family)